MEEDNDLKIKELLTRGVEEIIDKDNLEKRLKSGKELRIKLGIDPTSPNIHIGRAVPLLKLRDFQKLGHKVIFIIGDFTGVIGDTSDKESERPMIQSEQVKKNMENYINQASKILDISKCEVHYNSEWLERLGYREIGEHADVFSVSNFIARDNIKRRLDAGKRVSLREVLYPLMQGYDSVAIKADVELGGTDQKFNLLAGRELQKHYNQEPQDILTNPLIEGLDGRKMSSSWGNVVNVFDEPNDMYGKIMSLKDEYIIKYFTFTTRVPLSQVDEYKKSLDEGANPRNIKMKLAYHLVSFYHNEKEAEEAQNYFINTFIKKETPQEIEEFKPTNYNLVSFLIESQLVTSKSEARRVVGQGGVKINGEVLRDLEYNLSIGDVIQKGKINFIKVI
ncbi:MAG: tyrosine--tRNA ligase [Bacilli bacterium]|jgi:tyrosyl-tRNA synthetase|nr:tyrosine--tRNA ligase [Bacilli bacterium]